MANSQETRDTILSVPFISQYQDVDTKEYRQRACGMCCVRMTLLQFGETPPPIDDMITEGMKNGGYSESGWRHDYFVSLFQKAGYGCERKELMQDVDVVLFRNALIAGNPVLVSSQYHTFGERLFHMVLLIGVREGTDGAIEGFFYQDPARIRAELYVSLADFLQDWRHLAIFPTKNTPA